ncbi:MAG: hypothetical protein ACOCWG_02990, partial [bacterium]
MNNIEINSNSKLLGNILLAKGNIPKEVSTELSLLRRETVTKPVIFIGAGTCGLGAGADKTKKEIEKFIAEHDVDADVLEVGCIGLCSMEPLV